MESAVEAEIETLWQKHLADDEQAHSVEAEFRQFRDELWQANCETASKGLQPWLLIFELGLDWLLSVYVAISKEDGGIPTKPERRIPWALIGAAIAFGWSLRQLCVQGFDTPARALLRTYVETLLLCIAVLDDKSLGDEYAAAQDETSAKNFWHTSASPRRLHQRIMEIERRFGFEAEAISALAQWRRTEYVVLSESAHLSYVAAAVTCMPSSILDGQHGFGVLGRVSNFSIRTLVYAAKTTWYFSQLSSIWLVSTKDDSGLLSLESERKYGRLIVAGREVLSEVIRTHWDDEMADGEH